jgi:hypothetical protein
MTGMVTKTVTRGMIPAYRGGFVRTLTIALLLLLLAPLGARAQTDERPRDDPFLEMWARSFYPGRSGDIMLVPREGDILTSETDPFMHGSPWGYDTQVPMILYGPGRIRSGRYAATASHQDLGATLISILGLINRPEATGHVLETTLGTCSRRHSCRYRRRRGSSQFSSWMLFATISWSGTRTSCPIL